MKISLLLRQHCSHLGRQGSCDGDVDKHCLLGPLSPGLFFLLIVRDSLSLQNHCPGFTVQVDSRWWATCGVY